jgi:hypothetical protein
VPVDQVDSVLSAPGDGVRREPAVGDHEGEVRAVYRARRPVHLLEDRSARRCAGKSFATVLALDSPDAALRIHGAHVAGVIAGTAELLCPEAVSTHEVANEDFERTVM